MDVDYKELRQRILDRLQKNHMPESDNPYTQIMDVIQEQIVTISVMVVAEYEQMKKESQN